MSVASGQLKVYDLNVRDSLQLHHVENHEVFLENVPFASGGCREAFVAHFKLESGQWGPKMVAKRYIRSEAFLEDYVCAHMAYECARAFNMLNPPKPVDYLVPNQIFTLHNVNYSIEKFLQGQWLKHNNIFGMILSDRHTPNAFSHFSYIFSSYRYIILDVQGVGDTFTDPAVVSVTQGRFGYTDTGLKGIRDFFRNHKCNDVCRAMNLPQFTEYTVHDVPWDQPLQAVPLMLKADLANRAEPVSVKVVIPQKTAQTSYGGYATTNPPRVLLSTASCQPQLHEKKDQPLRQPLNSINPTTANSITGTIISPATVSFLQNEVDRLYNTSTYDLKRMIIEQNVDCILTGVEKKDLVKKLVLHFYPDYKIEVFKCLRNLDSQPPCMPSSSSLTRRATADPTKSDFIGSEPRVVDFAARTKAVSNEMKSSQWIQGSDSSPKHESPRHNSLPHPSENGGSIWASPSSDPSRPMGQNREIPSPRPCETTNESLPDEKLAKGAKSDTSPITYRISDPFRKKAEENVQSMSVTQLRARLYCLGVDHSTLSEKEELQKTLRSHLPENEDPKINSSATHAVPPQTNGHSAGCSSSKSESSKQPSLNDGHASGSSHDDRNGALRDDEEDDDEPPKVASCQLVSSTPPPSKVEEFMAPGIRRVWAYLQHLRRTMFLKYGKAGSPHRRFLQISPRWMGFFYTLFLTWHDTVDKDQHGEIALDALTTIQLGCAAAKFQRHILNPTTILGRKGQKHNSSLCFSLVFPKRSLDLLALTQHDFDMWVEGFKQIAEQNSSPHP